MIHYLKGDATKPQGDGAKIIMHICNNAGGWGAGFVLAVSKRWPEAEESYRAMRTRELGAVDFVRVEPELMVANMIAQDNVSRAPGPPIRYCALEKCLAVVRRAALGFSASVHCPRIGCGIAGGEWHEVARLITQEMPEIDVYVYDLA